MKKYVFIVAFYLRFFSSADLYSQNHLNATPQPNPVPIKSADFYTAPGSVADTIKRKAYLADLLNVLPADNNKNGRVSLQDKTFRDWLSRTGELPPDFDKMPSVPFLPDPLVLNENGKDIPVINSGQWKKKREQMKAALQYYITGNFPSAPENLRAKVLSERRDGHTTIRTVELSFGPGHEGKLKVELIIPEGKGPFPVFLTQWNHRGWALIAVRRGYIGCIYAGSDDNDDTEKYAEVWSTGYDFTRLMRRAFGASRAVDYLYTLSFVDKEKIGISGHSRNGKQSLWAAAFDDRIKAVITSSGGSGAEVPWRYASHKYDVEDIALLACAQPAWLHPRLRFFTGREDKLPVDENLFMALVAPRGLMLSTAISESASNPWGIEQAYFSMMPVYKFSGAENNLGIRFRNGLHGTRAGDIEAYIDFFDYVFKRSNRKPPNSLLYDYSFEKWRVASGEKINLLNYPKHKTDEPIVSTTDLAKDWEKKKQIIRDKIKWVLGDEPAGAINYGPKQFKNSGEGEDDFGTFLGRPVATEKMGRMAISPYREFGDYQYGYLYYPKNKEDDIKSGAVKLPVVIYLHEYDYSKGFASEGYDHEIQPFFADLVEKGFIVFSYDFIGFGNRIEEGTTFYQRYPHWSKMGRMVSDLQGALETLSNLDFVDSSKISVAGYSLGATVGLYTAALDKRISAVASVSGFTPMRSDTGKGTEGIRAYSHLHGLLPRLGFFTGNEDRIPYDFDELLASIAPRPLLVIAPSYDRFASSKDVQSAVGKATELYQLYNAGQKIQIYSPVDYNRFSGDMQKNVAGWLADQFPH